MRYRRIVRLFIFVESIVVASALAEADATDKSAGTRTLPVRARVDVPFFPQELSAMCGPTCIRMIFAYWGEKRHDEYQIATAILRRFPDEPRVVKSGILDDRPIDWSKYPGTGTRMMREFLKGLAPTENKRIKSLPADPHKAAAVGAEFFENLKGHLADGVPVVVHQYWKGPGTRGHYRVVTGYDDAKRTVYLHDPRKGPIEQTYAEFMRLWNVDKPWLAYNSVAFNVAGKEQRTKPLRIELGR